MATTTTKRRNMKQLVASLLVDAEINDGDAVYIVKTPRADLRHTDSTSCACYGCQPQRSGALSMYGLTFTDGVSLTKDRELADRIVAEFPDYKIEELA